MARKIKAVLDTNVLISAILTPGTSREVRDLARKGEFEAFTSHFILQEFKEKMIEKFNYPKRAAEEAVKQIKGLCTLVKVSDKPSQMIVSDPKDNPITETALKAKANYLITNDNKILALGKYKQVKIKTPAEFLGLIKNR